LGQVIWNFNRINNVFIVENNILTTGPEDVYSGFDSGTYSFEIEQDGEAKTRIIEGIEYGMIILSPNSLIIDPKATDSFIFELIR